MILTIFLCFWCTSFLEEISSPILQLDVCAVGKKVLMPSLLYRNLFEQNSILNKETT